MYQFTLSSGPLHINTFLRDMYIDFSIDIDMALIRIALDCLIDTLLFSDRSNYLHIRKVNMVVLFVIHF
jgi:hypothetical protein